ncbi:MAG: preprotein translocase subunit SecE [Mycobacteriaceae bacterium]|nr:preprotein translocase subunit SecE [Mycobacteriaceae bacterium]
MIDVGERDGDAVAVDGDRFSDVTNRPSGKRSSRLSERRASRADSGGDTGTLSRSSKDAPGKRAPRGNPIARIIQFVREVVAELRKVIWPNRKQMVTYTIVVLVFVAFMVAYISGLDYAFVKAVTWLFG